jgi:hypothetical protein
MSLLRYKRRSLRHLGTGLLSIACCVLFEACSIRHTYYYFAFDSIPGIIIVEGAMQDRRLRGANVMPLRYLLQRDRYVLSMSNEIRPVSPYLLVRIDSLVPNEPLQIVLRPERSASESRCASVYGSGSDDGLSIRWLCDIDGPHLIAFDVMSASGELLAEETLHFVFIENGWFVENDLL